MLLSALTLAALLQIAPAAASTAPTVIIPEATPVVGQKGYLLQRRPFNTVDRVDQLRMPFAKHSRAMSPEAARAQRFVSPSLKLKPQRKRPPVGFVRNPQMVSCDTNGLTRAGHPETATVQPLSKMPKAHGERAVARLVDGCPVAVMIAQR
jgi:hypothetical protein